MQPREGGPGPAPFLRLRWQQLGAGAAADPTQWLRQRPIAFVIQRRAGAPLAQLLPGPPRRWAASGGEAGGGLRASVSRRWGNGGSVPPTGGGCASRVGNSGLRPRERCGGRPGVGPPSPAAPRPAGSARPGRASPLKGTGSPRAGRGAPLSHRARAGGPRAAPLSPPDPFREPGSGSALLPAVPRPPEPPSTPPSQRSRCSPSLSQFVPLPPRPAPSRSRLCRGPAAACKARLRAERVCARVHCAWDVRVRVRVPAPVRG